MIYRARTGTKVKVAETIAWESDYQKELYADRIAKLGNKTWKVDIARDSWAAIKVGDDFVVVPKFALDRAA